MTFTTFSTDPYACMLQVLVSSFLDADKLGGALTAPRFTGMGDCIRQTYRAEGLVGFYKGLSPTLLKSFVGTAVTFGEQVGSENAMAGRSKAIFGTAYYYYYYYHYKVLVSIVLTAFPRY